MVAMVPIAIHTLIKNRIILFSYAIFNIIVFINEKKIMPLYAIFLLVKKYLNIFFNFNLSSI